MKTIMDYKEKYEEALERARMLKNQHPTRSESDLIDAIFPELAESEDERIRKEMVEFLDEVWHLGRNTNFDRWDKADCSDWIAYLEKQKDEAKRQFDLGVQAGREEALYEMEKHKEQKPAEQIHNEGYVKGVEDAFHRVNEAKVILKKLEKEKHQPAEWSEEDDDYLSAVKRAVYDYFCEGYAEELYGWLKALPERFNLSPKQEWSEEDEKIWKDIFDLCNRFGYDDACRLLKSISRKSWKPSEAQMQWLESAVKLSTDKPYIHGIIISLYEQLKRL